MKRLTPTQKLDLAEEAFLKATGWKKHKRFSATGMPLTTLWSPPRLMSKLGRVMLTREHAVADQREYDKWKDYGG